MSFDKEKIPSIASLISYPISEKVVPSLYKLGLTPNSITLLNFLFRIYIFYILQTTDRYIYAGVLFSISQIFDCFDGHMARKYNMTSELGKKLDINLDIITRIIIYNVLLNKFKNKVFRIIIILSTIIDLYLSLIIRDDLVIEEKYYYFENNVEIIIMVFSVWLQYNYTKLN
jgi:phosphatidylglycerophosphate synthase